MGAFLVFAFVFWVLPILICHQLGQSRNRTGWLWGLLLGWLGVLIVALMRPVPLHEQIAAARAQEDMRRWQLEQQNQQLLAELDARPRKP